MHRNNPHRPGEQRRSGIGQSIVSTFMRSGLLYVALLSALLTTLVYQIPVSHSVDIGGYDAAYTRGFSDPVLGGAELEHSDGSARWISSQSFLLFPQAGWPAQISLHMRSRPGTSSQLLFSINNVLQPAIVLGDQWQDIQLPIPLSLSKPEDTLLAIQSVSDAPPEQSQQATVLLERAVYSVGPAPILPAPSQLLYATLLSVLLALLIGGRETADDEAADRRTAPIGGEVRQKPLLRWPMIMAIVLPALLLLVFYRIQTPYPYPLRGLLQTLCLLAAAMLAVRHAPTLARRAAWLPDLLALTGMLVWAVALWNAAQAHVLRSVPGVENDFRVFATRTELASIFKADGFYNLGYPLLLWLAGPFTKHNPFLAGRLIGLLAALVLLALCWWLARRWFGSGTALIALAVLALSPMFVQYALYLGSDMPFAAMCMLALTLLIGGQGSGVRGQDSSSSAAHHTLGSIVGAGICAGCAFLIRHPGLLLLPVGWIALTAHRSYSGRQRLGLAALFTLVFMLTITAQIVVNIRDTGQALYSQQAKNIWLAVLGDGDWRRWDEVSNDIGLLDVVRQSPQRFLASWWSNMRGFVGSGAEDTSEFGHAMQLRLLGFPANWLALGGLLLWGIGLLKRTAQHPRWLLLLWLLLYLAAICVGFALPRFFLPFVPIYALAAANMLKYLSELKHGWHATRTLTGLALLLIAFLWGGFAIGTGYVLRARAAGEQLPGQDIHATAAVSLIMQALPDNMLLVLRVPPDDDEGLALGKYSAIAHRFVSAEGQPADWRARGAGALLWSQRLGRPPVAGAALGQAGPYVLYLLPEQ